MMKIFVIYVDIMKECQCVTDAWAGKTSYMAIKISVNNNFHCGWVNATLNTLNNKIIFNYSDYQQNSCEDIIVRD